MEAHQRSDGGENGRRRRAEDEARYLALMPLAVEYLAEIATSDSPASVTLAKAGLVLILLLLRTRG